MIQVKSLTDCRQQEQEDHFQNFCSENSSVEIQRSVPRRQLHRHPGRQTDFSCPVPGKHEPDFPRRDVGQLSVYGIEVSAFSVGYQLVDQLLIHSDLIQNQYQRVFLWTASLNFVHVFLQMTALTCEK